MKNRAVESRTISGIEWLYALGVALYFSLACYLFRSKLILFAVAVALGSLFVGAMSIFLARRSAPTLESAEDDTLARADLLQFIPAAVIVLDGNGIIRVFNSRAEEYLGTACASVLGTRYDILPEPVPEQIAVALRSGAAVRQELTIQHGEDTRELSFESVMLERGAAGRELLVILVDITGRKQLEREMRNADRLAAVGVLAAGLAHEIKNPLVSIKTFAQLLPEKYEDPEFRDDFSNIMVSEVDRIDKILMQLLTLSRPAEPTKKSVELNRIVEHVLSLFMYELSRRDIAVEKRFSEALPHVKGNPELLTQVVINLLLNAMDTLEDKPPGTRAITVTTCPRSRTTAPQFHPEGELILNFADGTEPDIILSIGDTGEGIAEHELPLIFKPFYTTSKRGQGLGLAIVRNCIEEHHGRIRVLSTKGAGTIFELHLPGVNVESKI